MDNTEFQIEVRPERHSRSCTCDQCEARVKRLIAYFHGKTEDRGVIPGSLNKSTGQPVRYRSKGRRIMGRDLVYQKIA